MGAKARRLPVQTNQQKEIDALVNVLHILDHVVKHRPPVAADREAKHRVLVAQYVEARNRFTARRDELHHLVRTSQFHLLPDAVKAMDEAEHRLRDDTDELTLYRESLEGK